MTPRDILSALTVALVLGLSFVAIKIGVGVAPPFLLAAFRFAFAAFPAILFVSPPKSSARLVAAYGLLVGTAQFGFLFAAIHLGMPAGLASLVIQFQVFVTVFLAWLAMGERPRPEQMLAAGVSLAGIMLIGSARLGGASLGPFLLVLLAAVSWGAANVVGKKAAGAGMFAFTIWSSLVSPVPLLALSFWTDQAGTLRALTHPAWTLVLCVAWLAFGGTVLGFGLWSRLLSRYPASVVTPFALLIPVAGMAAGWLIFAEPLSVTEAAGALVVMAGLWINVSGARFLRWRTEARL